MYQVEKVWLPPETSTAPQTLVGLQLATLQAHLAQLEANIMSQVQTILEKTIETSVRTIVEKLILSGMFPLGAPRTLATMLTGAIPVASTNMSSLEQTCGPASCMHRGSKYGQGDEATASTVTMRGTSSKVVPSEPCPPVSPRGFQLEMYGVEICNMQREGTEGDGR